MLATDRDPFRQVTPSHRPPARSGWKDALLVASFLAFIYIFITTGGFFPSPEPTPTFGPPTAIAVYLQTPLPSPTLVLLTPTATAILPKLSNQHPSIRGNVIEIYRLKDKITGAYVRGRLEADTTVAQSFVKFSDDTKLYIKRAGQYQPGYLSDMMKGDTVEILFATPVPATSDNQAQADEIVILK